MTKNIPQKELEGLIQAADYDLKVSADLIEAGELQGPSYHPRMKAVHEENLRLLEEFLFKYGCSELGGKNLKINNREFDSFYYT